MSLITHAAGTMPRRQAASLAQTLQWYLERAWRELEELGQRRAAVELRRLAPRLAERQPEMAAQLLRTAREWAGR